MPWGTTTFTLLYDWVARRDAGSPTNIIGATEMLAQEQDLADGLEACVKANGDIAATANLPMATFKHTNVGASSSRTDYLRVAEFQDGGHVWIAGGGTADAIAATYAPALTALTNGQCVRVRAASANATTTPTFAPNGLAAKTIVKGANAALVAGDIAGNHHELQLQYNSTTDKWHLLNPAYGVSNAALDLNALTTDATGGDVADFLAFVDASEGNASNKVTVQKFYDVSVTALTAITALTSGDKIIASTSGVAKSMTADNFLISGLQLLTTDATGGAVADFIPFVDASATNEGNKVLVSDFVYNFLNNGTADTAPDPDVDHVLTRDSSASAYKKVLVKDLASSSNVDAPGYKGAPVIAADSSTSFALTDCGKTWYHTSASAHTWTIPANASVAFPVGTIILLENENGGGNVTIAITTDTLRWGSSTGSRTLAANGSAAIKKVASTTWRLTGTGIS